MAIGAYEQTILDMTAAYAGMANRGVFFTPSPFEEIRGLKNELLWSRRLSDNRGKRAVDSDVADTMNWMLQRVVTGGDAGAAGHHPLQHPVHGVRHITINRSLASVVAQAPAP